MNVCYFLRKTNILKKYLWYKYTRIIYTFLLEDILPWHRFKGFLVPSGPTNLIPVDEIHYNIFSLMLLKLLPEFDSFNVKIDRISKSLNSHHKFIFHRNWKFVQCWNNKSFLLMIIFPLVKKWNIEKFKNIYWEWFGLGNFYYNKGCQFGLHLMIKLILFLRV